MTELEQMMAEDAGKDTPTTQEMKDLNELIERQMSLEKELEALDRKRAEIQDNLNRVQCVAIPNLMDEIGIREFRLSNGMKVSVREDIRASIRADQVENAIRWLETKGLSGIVKDEIKVNFGKGDKEMADAFMDYCEKHGYPAQEKMSVHPQTLRATVKEQMERGIEFPNEYFSIFADRRTQIKEK